jgi:FeS assembly SUF system protein
MMDDHKPTDTRSETAPAHAHAATVRDIMPLAPLTGEIRPMAAPAVAMPAHLGSMPDIPGGVQLPSGESAIPQEELEQLTADIVGALKTVYDPEIPCDIYELGLIYKIDVSDDRMVDVEMTLTAPGCPVAGEMPIWVENAVNAVPGVSGTKVNLTFTPPWEKSRMSDEARLALNMF